MPSTTSSTVSVVLDSSTVMTPSPPTFSMASATSSPIAGSLCAEMVATCAFSLRLPTGRASSLIDLTAASSARSRPRLRSTALAPRSHVAHALSKDRVRQHSGSTSAVADDTPGLLGGLAQHLYTQFLLRTLELEL